MPEPQSAELPLSELNAAIPSGAGKKTTSLDLTIAKAMLRTISTLGPSPKRVSACYGLAKGKRGRVSAYIDSDGVVSDGIAGDGATGFGLLLALNDAYLTDGIIIVYVFKEAQTELHTCLFRSQVLIPLSKEDAYERIANLGGAATPTTPIFEAVASTLVFADWPTRKSRMQRVG